MARQSASGPAPSTRVSIRSYAALMRLAGRAQAMMRNIVQVKTKIKVAQKRYTSDRQDVKASFGSAAVAPHLSRAAESCPPPRSSARRVPAGFSIVEADSGQPRAAWNAQV
jgi:hypothetical protein